MINQNDLLDPLSITDMPERVRQIVDGAQNAGHGPRHMNIEHHTAGALQQVVNPSALKACGCGGPGAGSDISEGWSTLREAFEHISSPPDSEG